MDPSSPKIARESAIVVRFIATAVKYSDLTIPPDSFDLQISGGVILPRFVAV